MVRLETRLTIDKGRTMIDLQTQQSTQEPDWASAPLGELAAHIVATHHEYLRKLLPRLDFLVNKIADVHGDGHSELIAVAETFGRFVRSIEGHLNKEESHFFPQIADIAAGDAQTVRAAIAAHEAEHQEALDAFQVMRRLTNDFAVPADGCNTYHMTFEKLVELEADTREHIRKENLIFERLKTQA